MQDGTWLALGAIGLAGAIGATARRGSPNTVTLGELATVKIGLRDADFWLERRGTPEKVGKPTKQWGKERIGIRLTEAGRQVLLPTYLFYLLAYLHQQGVWRNVARGTIPLLCIGVRDVKGLRFQTGNANQLTAFEAIKTATTEIWTTRPGYGRRTLAGTYLEDIDLWLIGASDPLPPRAWSTEMVRQRALHAARSREQEFGAIASVLHEYATAPPEPYTNQATLNTWNRVGDRASELFGRGIYIESINPAVSQWFFV